MNEEKLFNYFYKITNLINGKFYYGIRSANSLSKDTTYMGSGKAIKEAIKKHGKENFKKEIIAHYSTRKEASDHERLVVDLEMINNPLCYNLKTGGDNGGIYYHSVDSRDNMSKARIGKFCGENSCNFGRVFSEEHKQKLKDSRRNFLEKTPHPNVGRICSEETKEKLREKRKGFTHSNETKLKLIEISIKNGKFMTRQCLIEGTLFNSVIDAMNFYNMSEYQIRMRCGSPLEKWNDWQFGEKVKNSRRNV